MRSLVPVVLGDIMRDERMLISGSRDRRDQGEPILQLVGDSKDAQGPELDVTVMSGRGALEHLWRWVERILARREPTPLQTVRSRRGLLNASHLHRVIKEPTIPGAARALARLNYGRGSRTVKGRGFATNLGVGIRELLLLSVGLLRLRIGRTLLLWVPLLWRAKLSRLSIKVLLGRVWSLLGVRRALLWVWRPWL